MSGSGPELRDRSLSIFCYSWFLKLASFKGHSDQDREAQVGWVPIKNISKKLPSRSKAARKKNIYFFLRRPRSSGVSLARKLREARSDSSVLYIIER